MTMANSDMQSGTTRVMGSGTTLRELHAEYEGPSRQRGTSRISTSTKLPETSRVTPSLVVDNRASMKAP